MYLSDSAYGLSIRRDAKFLVSKSVSCRFVTKATLADTQVVVKVVSRSEAKVVVSIVSSL